MSIFKIFKRNKDTSSLEQSMKPEPVFELDKVEDHLGPAAIARSSAKEAIRSGNYDEAWALFHREKDELALHANKNGFTARQAIALDASVSEGLANILRLESKHHQAFVHILYWVAANTDRPIKAHDQKLRAYFNRCKFTGVTLDEAQVFIRSIKDWPDFIAIQSEVGNWS